MKYTGFQIKNYKWVKDINFKFTHEPHAPVITLVWLNESGKTSILEAIKLFSEDIDSEKRHTLIPKSEKSNFNGNIDIIASFELDELDEKKIKKFANDKWFVVTSDIKTLNVTKRYIFQWSKFIEKTVLPWINLCGKKLWAKGKNITLSTETQEWKDIVNYIQTSLFPQVIYYSNFLFDFPVRIYIEEWKPRFTQGNNLEYVGVLQDVLDSIWDWIKISDIVTKIYSTTADDKESLEANINKMSDKITKVVFDAWWQLFDRWSKQIIVKYDKEWDEAYIEIKLKEWSESYSISERSLWFKRFFSFLLFTEFRKSRSNDYWETLFLLDEPASNLHSTAQKKLLSTFSKLAEKSKVIYTTHSHHLIDPSWLASAHIVCNSAIKPGEDFDFDQKMTDVKIETYKKFVANHPNEQSYFQPILDALEYQPSHLEYINDIVVVEWKNDFYTLRYFNEIILNNEFDAVKVYPWAWADKNYAIIRLYLAWNKDFVILLDWDDAGKSAKKLYIKEFGRIIEDKIYTLNEIDNSFDWKAMEDLFTNDEQLKIIQSFFTTETKYNKSKFNTALQNLHFDQQQVDLSDDTIVKFKTIFKFLSTD